MKGETLKGHLDLLLLAAVAPAPLHGYAVIEALRTRSGGAFDLAEGTVYPVLHRLEAAGFLRSRWGEQEGRRRRVYEVSAAGRKALAAQAEGWRLFVRSVDQVLRGATP
jgi:DNA-binding PadR family transcriptional regulator